MSDEPLMVDDEPDDPRTVYDPTTNTVYVRSKRCETCIFTKNRPVPVRRVNGMVADADRGQSSIPCHKHLYVGEEINPICRGYWDHGLREGNNITLRLAAALEIVRFV